MSIWSTLGIEPTKDKRKIKRAYAKMAARYHPEEQPEKFQEVYNAYEQAVSYAEGYAGTEFHYEKESEPEVSLENHTTVQKSELSHGNHTTIQKSEMIDFYKLTADSSGEPEPVNEDSIDFDGKIPRTPRQRIVIEDNKEKAQIDFEGKIPKAPRQGWNPMEADEEAQIDFEQLVPDSGRKLMLKPTAEQTINFDSIVREDPPIEPPHHKEPGKQENKKKKMSLQEALKIIVVIGTWCFILGLLHQFTGGDVDDSLGLKGKLSGLEQVKHILEEKYDDEFYVSSIDTPDTLDSIYYLIADGKVKEDYQWFYCSRNDGTLLVQFYAALDDSGAISYNYSYKELLALIDYVGLGNYLDVSGIQKDNLEYMEKGEKRYCYPILKLSSGNLNEDFFQEIKQLSDMIQESDAQFYNSNRLTINIKNSNTGGVYHFHIQKGKKQDMEKAEQEIRAFFGV